MIRNFPQISSGRDVFTNDFCETFKELAPIIHRLLKIRETITFQLFPWDQYYPNIKIKWNYNNKIKIKKKKKKKENKTTHGFLWWKELHKNNQDNADKPKSGTHYKG